MNEIVRYISAVCIAMGGLLTVYGGIKYHRIINSSVSLPGKLPAYAKAIKHISKIMLALFIAGYAIGFIDILFYTEDAIFFFVGIIFFCVAVFLVMLIQYLGYMVDTLKNYNNNLQNEVKTQLNEILHQDRLFRAVNETVSILLASDTKNFNQELWRCMGALAQCVDVDRLCIWKNQTVGGKLYCVPIYEWFERAELKRGSISSDAVSYSETLPGWENLLSCGSSINCRVQALSQAEQDYLVPQDILSILVVPIFLNDGFWGFMRFGDCRKERIFTKAEEDILRSASLLFATCTWRNEVVLELMAAKDAADRGARAKSHFLSNMSHEIRTPINAIVGMSAIAQNAEDMSRITDCMKKISVASRQLLGIINDILDMSKIEAGKMTLLREHFDLHALLYNIKSIIGVRVAEKDIDFAMRIGPDVPKTFVGDEMRLTQILLNLLSNAVKFTPEKGKVGLVCSLHGRSGASCTLRFDVKDTGIGISKEEQSRVFTAFEQAESNTSHRYGGTGLGLAISKKIAAMMCGDISLVSEKGAGSCFTVRVTLPTCGGEAVDRKESIEVPDDFISGRVFLLAEDVEINREIAATLLQDKGATVVCAENGAQAVEIFSDRPEQYDLILMDVHMPVMDGLEATKAIRALSVPNAKTIPILAMTANVFEDDIIQCVEAGMDGHIAKPIDIRRLFKTLYIYLA